MKTSISQRTTVQKQVLLEELRKTKLHPTAQDIYRAVKRRLPRISFGTVYRNLNMLRDKGEILELGDKPGCRYDGFTREHCHFFCESCKRVFDISARVDRAVHKAVLGRLGFKVRYRRINFYGHCGRCAGLKK